MGSVECNRLVVGLMRKALVAQAKANEGRQLADLKAKQARRLANLDELLGDMGEGDVIVPWSATEGQTTTG